MTSWLNKQRKQTLLELSSEAGLQQDEESRKDELVENLDTYLHANATRLSRNSIFEPYFATRRTPFKPRSSSAAAGVTSDDGEVKSVVKARGRRTTKVKQEIEDGATSPSQALVSTSSAVTRTPGRPRRQSELPPSPADIAEDVEHATTRFYSGLDDLYTLSGIPEWIESVRDTCSSVTSVQMTFLLIEAFGLQCDQLPWKPAFNVPASPKLAGFGTPNVSIPLPDLFRLLTGEFWTTTFLWSSTSLLVPLLFAYFYNLSTRDVKRHGAQVTVARYSADPLTFNVVKALLTFFVYGHSVSLGLFSDMVAYRVDHAMFGGYQGVLIGAYVGILAAIYDAAQRK